MARCSKCGRKAVIRIHYARMNLCAEHFIEYFEGRVKSAVIKYGMLKHGDSVLVAVSGGKDSAALLASLTSVSKELGIKVKAVHLNLGIGSYSAECLKVIKELSKVLGINVEVVGVKDVLGVGIAELARRSGRPECAVCGLVKRYFINAYALTSRVNAVATGHHIDDLAPYALKNILLGNIGSAAKLGPVAEGVEDYLVRRVRPLYEVYERECLVYALIKGLPFVRNACPYTYVKGIESEVRLFMDSVDVKHPGIKLRFMRSIAKEYARWVSSEGYGRCRVCGMPSRGEVCGFCRLTRKALGVEAGPSVIKYLSRIAGS